MGDQNRNMPLFDGDQQGKYRKFAAELRAVTFYLSVHNATATMTAIALQIYRPNLCRHKYKLQSTGQLIVTHRDTCKVTGFKADYLSCDPDLVKKGGESEKES